MRAIGSHRGLGGSLCHGGALFDEEGPGVKRGELVEALDHPIFFSFVITLVVVAWLSILTWAAKAGGLPGPAALFQHP